MPSYSSKASLVSHPIVEVRFVSMLWDISKNRDANLIIRMQLHSDMKYRNLR
ncbi:hypothetical protein CCP3SC1_560011 [Gammaproteobacteria bacterium]